MVLNVMTMRGNVLVIVRMLIRVLDARFSKLIAISMMVVVGDGGVGDGDHDNRPVAEGVEVVATLQHQSEPDVD